jgi:hypothetical protein
MGYPGAVRNACCYGGCGGCCSPPSSRTGVHGDRPRPRVVEGGPGGRCTYRRGAASTLVARWTSSVAPLPLMMSTRTPGTLPTVALVPATTTLTLSLAATAGGGERRKVAGSC